jgi:hypothetical protein
VIVTITATDSEGETVAAVDFDDEAVAELDGVIDCVCAGVAACDGVTLGVAIGGCHRTKPAALAGSLFPMSFVSP